MALRHQDGNRRFLGLSAGLLLCAVFGCNTTDERRPLMTPPPAKMGAGNQVMSQPLSPAYNNPAFGNQQGGNVAYNPNSPNVNPQIGNNPQLNNPGMMQNRNMANMPMTGVQQPYSTMNNPASFNQPMMQQPMTQQPAMQQPMMQQPVYNTPNGQMMPANNGQQQGYVPNGYPMNNQGYQAQSMPAQQMQTPNMPTQLPPMQNMPMQNTPMQNPNMSMQPDMNLPTAQPNFPAPMLNPPPLSSSNPMNDVKVPDQVPTSLKGSTVKDLTPPPVEGPSLLPVSATEGPNLSLEPPPSSPSIIYDTRVSKRTSPPVNVAPQVHETVIPAPLMPMMAPATDLSK